MPGPPPARAEPCLAAPLWPTTPARPEPLPHTGVPAENPTPHPPPATPAPLPSRPPPRVTCCPSRSQVCSAPLAEKPEPRGRAWECHGLCPRKARRGLCSPCPPHRRLGSARPGDKDSVTSTAVAASGTQNSVCGGQGPALRVWSFALWPERGRAGPASRHSPEHPASGLKLWPLPPSTPSVYRPRVGCRGQVMPPRTGQKDGTWAPGWVIQPSPAKPHPSLTERTLTQEDAAGHAGNALDLRDVVLHKIRVTGGAGCGAVAEEAPEGSGGRAVAGGVDFGADIEAASGQRAVPQQTDPGREWGSATFLNWPPAPFSGSW